MFPDFQPHQRAKLKVLAFFSVVASVGLIAGIVTLQIRALSHGLIAPVYAAQDAPRILSPISIDYPEDGSIFPPGITPPTFLWRDAAGTSWSIDIEFADKSPAIHAASKGERMRLGDIDPDASRTPTRPPN